MLSKLPFSVFAFFIYSFAFAEDDISKDYIGGWEQRILNCINAEKSKSKINDALCLQVAAQMRREPFQWDNEQWFLKDESVLRQKIKEHGLDLDISKTPADFVYLKTKSGEVLVVFWGFIGDKVFFPPNDMRLLRFGWNLEDPNRPSDPGMFPIAFATIFTKKNGLKWTEQHLKTDTTFSRKKTSQSFSAGFWFSDLKKVDCPASEFVFKHNIGICLSNFHSNDWPEIHVWRDHLASTGHLMDSYIFDGEKYKPMLIEVRGFYKTEGTQTLFFTRNPGEGWSETWYAMPEQKILIFDNKKMEYVVDKAKTRKIRPVCTPLKSGLKDGVPRSPGLYENTKTKECFEVFK